MLLTQAEIEKILDESRWRKVRGRETPVAPDLGNRQYLKDALAQLQDELSVENGADRSTQ